MNCQSFFSCFVIFKTNSRINWIVRWVIWFDCNCSGNNSSLFQIWSWCSFVCVKWSEVKWSNERWLKRWTIYVELWKKAAECCIHFFVLMEDARMFELRTTKYVSSNLLSHIGFLLILSFSRWEMRNSSFKSSSC